MDAEITRLVSANPELTELYPLRRFLSVLLDKAEDAAGAGPVGCYVPISRTLAVRRRGKRARIAVLGEDAASALSEELEAGEVTPSKLGGGPVAEALADTGALFPLPCPILARPVGYLLLPRSGSVNEPMDSIARLAGYYLHRHEIEVGIERLGAKAMIMGCTPAMFRLQEAVERFAPLREPVLILGESGSGKEIFAEAIHVLSPRRDGPFIPVDCAAAPDDNLLLDEFFGHRRGAFTGAAFDTKGCCQQADGGSLFLDEIGEMSHELQTLLLRTLTVGEVRQIGSQRATRVDVRVISATHKDLAKAIRQRAFRSDLYYRISAFQIRIPPLRERLSDLRCLADYILFSFSEANSLPAKRLTAAALHKLEGRHSWPGNIRELENLLKRAFVMAPTDRIDAQHLEFDADDSCLPGRSIGLIHQIREDGGSFWDVVHRPFMRRELRRDEVAELIDEGLVRSGGRLKTLASYLNVAPDEYGRFVSFLHRHGFRSSHRRTG